MATPNLAGNLNSNELKKIRAVSTAYPAGNFKYQMNKIWEIWADAPANPVGFGKSEEKWTDVHANPAGISIKNA